MIERALERAAPVLEAAAKSTRLLDALAWKRNVERAFFAAGASRLPEPRYAIDRARAEATIVELEALVRDLAGAHPTLVWLRDVAESHMAANRMLLAVETKAFYALSRELYGGARTTALDADTTNLDFAEHLAERLGAAADVALDAASPRLDAAAFATLVHARLAQRSDGFSVDVVVDDDLTAKVAAGTSRIRVREDATFDPVEADGLYAHEVETHALTAQNAAAQARLAFLRSGGPRTTRTQEGLAVFSELYDHDLTTARLRRLVARVRIVAMAEEGASFLDVYRALVAEGTGKHEAFLDAQRIFRGGLVGGGAPFTKDAAYLSGLIDVYNFLRLALRAGPAARVVAEVLVSGRIALEDMTALVALRRDGVLAAPQFVPAWLARHDRAVAYFAFTSFLEEVDLAPMRARHRALLAAVNDDARP